MEIPLFESIKKRGGLSEYQSYRYRLWRIWDQVKPKVMFIMLNPSKPMQIQMTLRLGVALVLRNHRDLVACMLEISLLIALPNL